MLVDLALPERRGGWKLGDPCARALRLFRGRYGQRQHRERSTRRRAVPDRLHKERNFDIEISPIADVQLGELPPSLQFAQIGLKSQRRVERRDGLFITSKLKKH